MDPGGLPLISCAPLGFVLERLALRHIHFWSLDVEGAELEVLRTVDFSQVGSFSWAQPRTPDACQQWMSKRWSKTQAASSRKRSVTRRQ